MNFKNIILSFILLFITWMLLNSSFDVQTIGVGIVVSLFVSFAICSKCEVFSAVNLSPKGIIYFFTYFFVFMGALLKSNLDVARRVVSPSLPINPGIVEVETKLKSKIGRLVLANSITLTPGTLTVDIKDDKIYIHWINVTGADKENATKEIVKTFEKYLEVIYG